MIWRNQLDYQSYNDFQLNAFADIQAEDVLIVSYPGSDDQQDTVKMLYSEQTCYYIDWELSVKKV